MNTALNLPVIGLLVRKDWQLFQKQFAANVLAGILALCLLGTGKPWSFYLGSLLLIVVLVSVACFAISNSLLVERKELTLPFVMSLPVSPLDFTVAKLAGNLVTFGVPFLLLLIGVLATVAFTALPNGLIVYSLLLFGYIFVAYCISLMVAMNVESEGWNIFAMIGSMVLINPFIMLLGQIEAISGTIRGNAIVWSAPAVGILVAEIVIGLSALAVTAWWNGRRPAFY
ncbi:hypothetical protein OS176_05465 [Xanthomonadaceae bacterium XH05]|nr:hypothetical protein [Xanthomonadaceae bacterium XH05]